MLLGELTDAQPLTDKIMFRIIERTVSLQWSLNAYAYTNEDDTRAFINFRMNVTGVRPYANLTENNEILPSRAIRTSADRFDNELNLKLKYMIYKYVWQNIDDENVVQQQRLNKELFAHHLSNLHEDLCNNNIILNGENFNPVMVNERFVRQRRQVERLAERVRDIEYLWNPRVVPVNWEHPALFLERILNPREPFPSDLISLPQHQMHDEAVDETE
ncbi:hypothetical protein G6F42_019910 [Rhizopus arrhizus]|nr:hypothetical protein G6F42_019910 [Rhizopus arrhizus]